MPKIYNLYEVCFKKPRKKSGEKVTWDNLLMDGEYGVVARYVAGKKDVKNFKKLVSKKQCNKGVYVCWDTVIYKIKLSHTV